MVEPLIYTSRGNLPIASLRVEASWDINRDYIKLVERYVDEAGEVVRESAHVYSFKGMTGEGAAGAF
jgi:hypothetical protein